MLLVRVEYSDGIHWLKPYTEEHRKAGLSYVEMSERDWIAYQCHAATSRLWQDKLRELGNRQHLQDVKTRALFP